jgi:hypothetical protein
MKTERENINKGYISKRVGRKREETVVRKKRSEEGTQK